MTTKQLHELDPVTSSGDDDIYHLQTPDGFDRHITKANLLAGVVPVARQAALDAPMMHLFAPNKFVQKLSGPVSFTRDSTATYVDRYGYVRTANSHVPRQDKNGWLIEGESTNYVKCSEDFTILPWQKSASGTGVAPVVTANFAEAPDGSNNATRVQFDQGGSATSSDFSMLQQDITDTTDDSVGSVWIKSNTGSAQTIGMQLGDSALSEITATSEWTRVSVSRATAIRVDLGLRASATSTADILIWGVQVEELPVVTSYIPTTTTMVTRPPEILTFNVQDNFLGVQQGEHSQVFNFTPLGDVGTAQRILCTRGLPSSNERFNVLLNTNTALLRYRDGSNQEASITATHTGTHDVVCITDNSSTVKIYLDGVKGTDNVVTPTAELDTTTQVFIGNDDFGSNPMYTGILKILKFMISL
jgi:hypothetical protein